MVIHQLLMIFVSKPFTDLNKFILDLASYVESDNNLQVIRPSLELFTFYGL